MGKKKFNDHPFPYRHELELEIATLTNLGVGLGRVTLPVASGQRSAVSDQSKNSGSPPSTLNSQPGNSSVPPSALSAQPPSPPSGGGWVIMVPFTLPGERVRVRVYRNHKNFSEADLLAVLTPSPHRIDPKCPLFGRCGGCQYQHLTYAEQLKWKRQQVAEVLKYMAGVEFAVNPVIGSPREFGYRSKITPHFHVGRSDQPSAVSVQPLALTAQPEIPNSQLSTLNSQPIPAPFTAHRSLLTPQTPPIGFLKTSHRFELIDVPQCPIATPEINAKLPEVRAKTHQRLAAGEYKRDATLLLRHAQEGVVTDYDAIITEVITVAGVADPGPSAELLAKADSNTPGSPTPATVDAISIDQPSAISPQPETSDSQPSTLSSQPIPPLTAHRSLLTLSAPLRLHFLARDFFQNNPFILPAFTAYVREQAAGSGARFLVDAYCGSGLFALSCAPAFERVAGVEISETSVKFATENAAANGITNATFTAGDAAQIFAGLTFPAADTAVVIDPPRKGCDESFLSQLFAFGPRAVVYVSCDPATQMRDLKEFLNAGYRLTSVQPFDLFPQTRHLECVITLVRT